MEQYMTGRTPIYLAVTPRSILYCSVVLVEVLRKSSFYVDRLSLAIFWHQLPPSNPYVFVLGLHKGKILSTWKSFARRRNPLITGFLLFGPSYAPNVFVVL